MTAVADAAVSRASGCRLAHWDGVCTRLASPTRGSGHHADLQLFHCSSLCPSACPRTPRIGPSPGSPSRSCLGHLIRRIPQPLTATTHIMHFFVRDLSGNSLPFGKLDEAPALIGQPIVPARPPPSKPRPPTIKLTCYPPTLRCVGRVYSPVRHHGPDGDPRRGAAAGVRLIATRPWPVSRRVRRGRRLDDRARPSATRRRTQEALQVYDEPDGPVLSGGGPDRRRLPAVQPLVLRPASFGRRCAFDRLSPAHRRFVQYS